MVSHVYVHSASQCCTCVLRIVGNVFKDLRIAHTHTQTNTHTHTHTHTHTIGQTSLQSGLKESLNAIDSWLPTLATSSVRCV